MTWEKLGLIFNPDCLEHKELSAALMPIAQAEDYENDIFKIYYSPRDSKGRSEFHSFSIDLKNPSKILKLSDGPLLIHGKTGAFDDSGITPGSILTLKDKTYFYYTGWNLTVNVPFNNSIGIARLSSDMTFERLGDGPILTRTLYEPYSCASPFVMFDNGIYRMWYASMDKWEEKQGVVKHYYNLKYAESLDGIEWKREAKVVINYKNENDYAFGRPFILKEDGLYKMWYAHRGEFYLIGYAESSNGIDWVRKDDEVGIQPSETGWDSDMIEYPFVFNHKGFKYMLYNGNGYGKTGIGLARRAL